MVGFSLSKWISLLAYFYSVHLPLMFTLSSLCSHIPLKQRPINNLMRGTLMSRMGESVLIPSPLLFFHVFGPSACWTKNDVELVTSYWGILIVAAVCQQYFILTARVMIWMWENIFPGPAMGTFQKRGHSPQIFPSALFILSVIFQFAGNYLKACLCLIPLHIHYHPHTCQTPM